MQTASRLRVVIVGAGFGGLEAARAMAHAPVDITLVDRRNHHLFQPLLYQVATAALSPGDIAWPVRSIFRRRPNVTVLMAEVTGVDVASRTVRTGQGALPYDVLVLATGARHNYFGNDQWEPFAPSLKTIEDATALRRRMLLAFERAEATEDPAERRSETTFVVVGGGATGVEMAGAISELARHALPGEFRHIRPDQSRIVLVEAGQRLLSNFPEKLSDYTRRSLEAMGVEVMTGTPVSAMDAAGVTVGDQHIAARTLVWGAGVAASPAATWLGAGHDKAGRVVVGPDLAVPGHPEIFAIGDTALVMRDGKPVPGIAPAAKQMGHYVGRLIAARATGRAAPKPFRYFHMGDLATIGRKSAVVSLGRLQLTGLLGWLFWSVAHVFFLIGFRSRVVVAFNWVWNYLTFQRGARLITARETEDDTHGAGTPGQPAPAPVPGAMGEPATSAP